jgi:hypothetical protein
MAKNINTRSIQTRTQANRPGRIEMDPNELKNNVRDGLVAMTMAEREEFIQALGAELKRISINMRAYLVPLGIPARSPEDLTPTEVGHLIRFLKINVPQAMPVVGRVMSRYSIFAEKSAHGDRLAA